MSKEIRPASRVEEIKEYYFSKKLKEIAKMQAEGADIISLGIGGPDRMPPSEAIEVLCDAAKRQDVHSYQPYVGLPELRSAFAGWYLSKYRVMLNPETQILPLIGSKEGILHVSLAFLNPGDGVLVPDPGYPTYSSVSKLVGAETYKYSLKPENGWQPDFGELESLPLDKIKLMWINYPHMPTGAKAGKDTFERLIEFAKRHNIVLAHDNPYSFILNPEPMSILRFPGAIDIAIELNSLSKSHNMAGWRFGMVASNPEFISWIMKVKSNIDSGQFKPMMLAAAKALEASADWYEDINREYARRRKIAGEIMEAIGCSFDSEQVGLFLWGRIPETAQSSEAFADSILYDRHIFVTPGSIFGSMGARYIRISLCAPIPRMREALSRLKKL